MNVGGNGNLSVERSGHKTRLSQNLDAKCAAPVTADHVQAGCFFFSFCLFVLCVLLQRGTEMFAVYSDELDRALAPPAELHVR